MNSQGTPHSQLLCPSHPVHHVLHLSLPVPPPAPNRSHVATSANPPATGAPAHRAPNRSSVLAVAAPPNTSRPAVSPSSHHTKTATTSPQAPSSSATNPAQHCVPAAGTSAAGSAARSRPCCAPQSRSSGATPRPTSTLNCSLSPPCARYTSVISRVAGCFHAATTVARGATTADRAASVRAACSRSSFVPAVARCSSRRSSAGRGCSACTRVRAHHRRVGIHM